MERPIGYATCCRLLACSLVLMCFSSCRYRELRAFAGEPLDVQEIHFKLRDEGSHETRTVVTNSVEINRILSNVKVGWRQMSPRCVLRFHMVVVEKDGSKTWVSFEFSEPFLRIHSKQYATTKDTIDLIKDYYAVEL